MKDFLRIIGDVHGIISCPRTVCDRTYIGLTKDTEFSIQLGDMGFDYDELSNVDDNQHVFIGGNHDNYKNRPPHMLGDFGYHIVHDWNFFYVRGELSIDKRFRIKDVSWWEEEQLTHKRVEVLLDTYEAAKPSIVLSHGCPVDIVNMVTTNINKKACPSYTAKFLSEMWKIHAPKYWIFGHHHNDWQKEINGTQFICLDELSFIVMDEYGCFSAIQ